MRSAVLYLMTVLIWGSTWLAIEFQIGVVAAEVSLVYRFAIAAILMWVFCLWHGLDMRLSRAHHIFVVVLAACNFGFNYLFLYWAQAYLSSAMTSIAFSTLLIFNIVNTRLFFGKPIAPRIYIGAMFGIVGIGALFWADLREFDLSTGAFLGLGLALIGTFLASLGNMISVRNSNKKIGVMQGNAWGMLIGSVLLFFYSLASGNPFTIDWSVGYITSLLYLSLFGTIKFDNLNGLTIGGFAQALNNVNGVMISLAGNISTEFSGLQLSFMGNDAYSVKGVQLCFASNSTNILKGVQIALFNKSQKTKGVQIGLWNVNEKRKLPIINWCFSSSKE